MSLTLALDTTSRLCSIAVLKDKEPLTEYNFVSTAELSETLIPRIHHIFSSLHIGSEDIGLVGASVGPGLFTGIRVGLATLKGIFFNREIPVVPVISLKAIAFKLRDTGLDVVPVIDARRGEIYTAAYRIRGGGIQTLREPALIRWEDLGEFPGNEMGLCFTGPGIGNHRERIEKDFPGCTIIDRSPFTACEVGLIAGSEFENKRFYNGTDSLEPLYIRIPDAEKNLPASKD